MMMNTTPQGEPEKQLHLLETDEINAALKAANIKQLKIGTLMSPGPDGKMVPKALVIAGLIHNFPLRFVLHPKESPWDEKAAATATHCMQGWQRKRWMFN